MQANKLFCSENLNLLRYQDAFVVCSTALKLQFQESIDKDLFHAYLTDWRTKQASLQVSERINVACQQQ